MKPRNYQVLTLNKIENDFKVKDELLCTSSMGSGKSLIIAKTTQLYYKSNIIVILVNISELIDQISKHLNIFNINHNIIKSGHDLNFMKNNEDNEIYNVWLIMEQSFHQIKINELNLKCDLLIKDEYHIGFNKKRFLNIKNSLKPKKILGLSGTPIDSVGYLLAGFKDKDLIKYGNAKELTEQGFLVPLKYYVPKWSEISNYENVKITNKDYNNKELDKVINTHNNIKLIVKSMNEMNAKNKKTIVYANSINHAENIFHELLKEDYKVKLVHSKIKKSDNIYNLKLFSNKMSCDEDN